MMCANSDDPDLQEQTDQGLHCLSLYLHPLDAFSRDTLLNVKTILFIVLDNYYN